MLLGLPSVTNSFTFQRIYWTVVYYFNSERLLLVPFLNYRYKANGSFQINGDCERNSTADSLLGKHWAVDNELLLSLLQ